MCAGWDAPGVVCEVSGVDGVFHGGCHGDGVLGAGDGGGEEDGVAAEFHGLGGFAGGADAGVEDDGDGEGLADHVDVVGVEDA